MRQQSYFSDTLDQLSRVLDRVPFVAGLKRDVTRLRRILYGRRPPRILVIGREGGDRSRLLNALLAKEVLEQAGAATAPEGRWLRIDAAGCKVDWLEVSPDTAPEDLRAALDEAAPDLVISLSSAPTAVGEMLQSVRLKLATVQEGRDEPAPLVAVVMVDKAGDALALDDTRHGIERLYAENRVRPKVLHTVSSLEATDEVEALSNAIVDTLPDEARLEAARAFRHANAARRKVANDVVHSSSTLAITVALTPIPLSDIAFIAPLQVAMVSTLAHLAGTPWDRTAVLKWMGSLGVVGGTGFGFRWTAQQLVKLIPGAGSLVSAGVAGAGTVALGQTAMAYFKL